MLEIEFDPVFQDRFHADVFEFDELFAAGGGDFGEAGLDGRGDGLATFDIADAGEGFSRFKAIPEGGQRFVQGVAALQGR